MKFAKVISIFIICSNILAVSGLRVNVTPGSLLRGAPFAIECEVNNGTTGCNTSNGVFTSVCQSIDLCMKYLSTAILQDPTKNTTLVYFPSASVISCPENPTVSLPASKLHVFYSQMQIYDGIICETQFMNIEANTITDILYDGIVITMTMEKHSKTPSQGGVLRSIYTKQSELSPKPSLTFYRSSVLRSRSNDNGGSIYSKGYMVNLIESSFYDSSSTHGGVLDAKEDSVNIIGSQFYHNSVSNNIPGFGGCVYSDTIYSESNIFSSNIASHGAAFYGKNVFVNDSSFYNNLAYHDGAGFSSTNSTVVTNSVFSGNRANYWAASFRCYGEFCLVQNSKFSNESSLLFGGSIVTNVETIHIDKSTFEDNHALKYGGSIFSNYNINITYSQFTGCSAEDGGVITIYKGSNTIYATDSYFINNNAWNGGVIAALEENCVFYLQDSVFKDNIAISSSGAIYSNGGYPSKMVGGIFYNNSCIDEKIAQTFNEEFQTTTTIVNIPISTFEKQITYYVPIVSDSQGIRAYGVSGLPCFHGEATIDQYGVVSKCSCYSGWSGSSCNQQQ